MIFISVGTHHGDFKRLFKRLDEIAPKIKEKIIVQQGFSNYKPKNYEYFDFTDNIDMYFKECRIAILQSATSLIEFVLKYNKPVITIPRQKKFKEHINNHQVEFAEYFTKKTGIKSIINIRDLTPELLKGYNKKASIDKKNLKRLQKYFNNIFNNGK